MSHFWWPRVIKLQQIARIYIYIFYFFRRRYPEPTPITAWRGQAPSPEPSPRRASTVLLHQCLLLWKRRWHCSTQPVQCIRTLVTHCADGQQLAKLRFLSLFPCLGLELREETFGGAVHYGVFCGRDEVIPRKTRYGPFCGKVVNTSEIKTNDDNSFMWEVPAVYVTYLRAMTSWQGTKCRGKGQYCPS